MSVNHLQPPKFCLVVPEPPFSSMLGTCLYRMCPSPSHISVSCQGPLTPQIEHGRSPLQCRPSPWPAGRDNHRSARPSCPGSSPARRWSALNRGGSTDNRKLGQTAGCQTGHTEATLPPLSLCLPRWPSVLSSEKGNGQQDPSAFVLPRSKDRTLTIRMSTTAIKHEGTELNVQ